jgi:hypothetical protein
LLLLAVSTSLLLVLLCKGHEVGHCALCCEGVVGAHEGQLGVGEVVARVVVQPLPLQPNAPPPPE